MKSARKWHFKGSSPSRITKTTIMSKGAAVFWCFKECPGGIRAGLGGRRVEGRGWEKVFYSFRLWSADSVTHGHRKHSQAPEKARTMATHVYLPCLRRCFAGEKEEGVAQHDSSPPVWRQEWELLHYSGIKRLGTFVSSPCCSHLLPGNKQGKVNLSAEALAEDGPIWPGTEGVFAKDPWVSYLCARGGKQTPHTTLCCPFKQLLGSQGCFIRIPRPENAVSECVGWAHCTCWGLSAKACLYFSSN